MAKQPGVEKGVEQGVDKNWLSQYPEGVPHEIDVNEFSSVVDIFERACSAHANQPAYTNFDTTITYAELHEKVTAFASYLQNEVGLKKGEAVAIMSPNLLQYPIAVFGILKAGGVVTNTNPMYTERELEHQLNDSGAKAIVVIENTAHVLADVVAKTGVQHIITTRVGDMVKFPKGPIINFVLKYIKKSIPSFSFPNNIKTISFTDALKKGGNKNLSPVEVGHADTAFLQYTGGTTGVAKGAQLLHKNMAANVSQARAWILPFTRDDSNDEMIVTALPMYHIFALTANCLTFMSFGAHNLLITDPRDMDSFVGALKKYPWTVITGVNTLFNGLVNHPEFTDIDFSRLGFALGGGAAVQKAVSDKWQEITGQPIMEAYGLTETSPAATMNPLNNPTHNSRIGVPLPSTEIGCFDDDMNEVADGERGELCIRGPQVMAGYWGRPEATAESITADGWFKTGDIAVKDEKGYFQIVDRKKDMILVSGFNVFPNEIEAEVAKNDKVLEVACIGIPDERSGEAVKVFVVKKDDSLDADELKAFCKEHMTGYKVPKYYEFRTELPKSNVGKILRKDLRAEELAKAG